MSLTTIHAAAIVVLATQILAADFSINPAAPNAITFPPEEAKFVRFVIHASSGGQPCLDELEVFGPDGARNLAMARDGAKASASSFPQLPRVAIR